MNKSQEVDDQKQQDARGYSEEEHLLSCNNLQGYKKHEENQMKQSKKHQNTQDQNKLTDNQFINKLKSVSRFILFFFTFFLYPLYLIFFGIQKYFNDSINFSRRFQCLWRFIWTICCTSIMYSLFSLIFSQNQIIRYFQVDGLAFYASLIFVFTFLKFNYTQNDTLLQSMDNENSFSTFQYLNSQKLDQEAYFLDYKKPSDYNNLSPGDKSDNNNQQPQQTGSSQVQNKQNLHKSGETSQHSQQNESKKDNSGQQQHVSASDDINQQNQQSNQLRQTQNLNNNQADLNQSIDNNIQTFSVNQNNIQNQQQPQSVFDQSNPNPQQSSVKSNKVQPEQSNQQKPQQPQSNERLQLQQQQTIIYKFKITDQMKEKEYSRVSLQFSQFLDEKSQINNPKWSVNQFCEDFYQYIEPNFNSFYILIFIFFLKIGFCFLYIFKQITQLSIKEYFDVFIILFLYIYNTFNLNRILGNNDLKRKYAFMKKLQTYMNFETTQGINLSERLDITCPISLEAWDNTRKFMLAYQEDWLKILELSYGCLFLQFILVTLVNLSSYFDLYWIFSEDSILLHPLFVIMSTFNFLFLSILFIIRIKEGNEFNDTFDDLDGNIVHLIDVMEDLITMFDVYFNNKKKENSQIDEDSLYGIIIKKIKYKSAYYIEGEKGEKFENKKYQNTPEDKSKLRKKILINAKSSLKKVKRSLTNDANKHKYKFFNLVEFSFKDTAFTLLVSFVTILPTVIPKFKNFFHENSS